MSHASLSRFVLAAALLAHLVIGLWWLTATPLQTISVPDNVPQNGGSSEVRVGLGPDEKEHYFYIRSLEEGRGIPAPDPARRRSPEQWVSYQAQHPPLFYAVAALFHRVGAGLGDDGGWMLLRALCLLLGGATVWFGSRALQAAFPDRPLVVLGGPAAIALLPMLGHMTGNLSNEPMAMALSALAWWLAVRRARSERPFDWRIAALVGGVLGMAAASRLTALIWLPTLLWLVWSRRGPSLVPVAAFLLAAAAPLVPWVGFNLVAFGQPVIRTFHRPLLDNGATIADFLGGGIVPPGFGIRVTLAATLLWFAGCAWTPTWLIQFYLPGGVAPLSALLLLVEVAVGLLLALHGSRARRGLAGPDDSVGRVVLRGAGATLAICIAGQVQQMLTSDWDVVLSTGRYTVAAVGASSLLLVFALSTRLAGERRQRVAAAALAALLLGFDLVSVGMVRRFYRDNPTQDSVQTIERN